MAYQVLTNPILASVLLMASSLGHFALAEQVYRWVDDAGVTHFTSHPPKNRPSDALRPQTGHSEPVDYSQSFPAPTDSTTASQDTADASNEQRHQQACEQARENLTTLERGGRIAVQDENGDPRFLDQKEVAERTANARQLITENC